MKKLNIADAHHRRKDLIHLMAKKESEGVHCFRCQGDCCTSFLNSMQITPLESLDLIYYFYKNNQIDETFYSILRDNVRAYRLDAELPSNGKRYYLRRSYTCPFYHKKTKGCGVSRSYKPYGCLAFNPTKLVSVDSEHCRSDQKALKQQWDKYLNHDLINKDITDFFSLDWELKPVSVAILSILEKYDVALVVDYYKSITAVEG